MDWPKREQVFSIPRMGRYLHRGNGESEWAANAYDNNILLGQALVPVLQTVEIAVRNAVHNTMSRAHGRSDWWAVLPSTEFKWLFEEICFVQASLRRRNEPATADKIVAELTFGSWTKLFNARHVTSIWRQLRLAFPHCPKAKRKSGEVRSGLNQVRNLRNRVMHYEPLLWLTPNVEETHAKMLELLDWIEPDIKPWIEKLDGVLAQWQKSQSESKGALSCSPHGSDVALSPSLST